jgi:hypothetical protein
MSATGKVSQGYAATPNVYNASVQYERRSKRVAHGYACTSVYDAFYIQLAGTTAGIVKHSAVAATGSGNGF